MIDTAMLISAFFTLFVIIDPIGLTPLFVALTSGEGAAMRRSIALRALLTSFGILIAFGIFGEAVLGFAGISMSAFRISGGVLLFLTALDMLFERRSKRRGEQAHQAEESRDDPSIFPLATPLIAGPGSITTMILLVGQADGTLNTLAVFAILFSVITIAFVLFSLGSLLERSVGPTAINIITRLLGMLLAALSIQFMIDGVREAFFVLG